MKRAMFSSSGSSKVGENNNNNNLKFAAMDKDYPYGYPWPPRYYTCSFCEREFRSAQALGGHMNIHRRDRARLRDLSPPPPNNNNNLSDQNPNPNPNFNPNINNNNINPSTISSPSSSSPTNNININTQQSYSLVSLALSSSTPPSHLLENPKHLSSSAVDHSNYQDFRVLKRSSTNSSSKEVVRLDLELCLGEAKEDLDLELRLGVK